MKDRTALLTPLHVGLSVSDMDRSIRWYRKALGFELLRDGYEPFLSARVTFLRHPCGLELELFQYDAPKPMPDERRTPNTDLQTIGTKHLCFHHPDVAGFLAGIPDPDIAAGPLDMHGDVVVFLRDPDGILLEFIQSSKPK